MLKSDPITVPGQRYALLSMIGPECPQKGEQLAIKIRGCFATIDDAKAHAAELIQKDKFVNIFIAAMYEWLPVPPKLDSIDDVKYQEDFLSKMFEDYKRREAEGRAAFEAHKQELMAREKAGASDEGSGDDGAGSSGSGVGDDGAGSSGDATHFGDESARYTQDAA